MHYCPSRFKDAVQLKERLRRRAERTSRPLDYVTDEGTIIHGIIEGDEDDLLVCPKDHQRSWRCLMRCTPASDRTDGYRRLDSGGDMPGSEGH